MQVPYTEKAKDLHIVDCGSLVVTVQTLRPKQGSCIEAAINVAKEHLKRWVLDLGAASTMTFRTQVCF